MAALKRAGEGLSRITMKMRTAGGGGDGGDGGDGADELAVAFGARSKTVRAETLMNIRSLRAAAHCSTPTSTGPTSAATASGPS
jgi:GTPase involved in cell partitioning and DNA repair